MARAELDAFIAENELVLTATFVPWSCSRNKDSKDDRGNPSRSLNWKVTIMRGTETLQKRMIADSIDYMAGIGHCPSYKPGTRWTLDYTALIAWECENGCKGVQSAYDYKRISAKGKNIKPELRDVLYSLAMDASVIDYACFEDWASEYGIDPDSRKGEAIYRDCLKTALGLRNALGEAKLAQLREACQDY
jgi:hypothetical protein